MKTTGITYSKKHNKWIAQYWNKELKTTVRIGTYDTEEEAIEAKENSTKDTKDKSLNLAKGVCITKSGKFRACIQFWYGKNKEKKHNSHLGSFNTEEEAVQARIDFINSLF